MVGRVLTFADPEVIALAQKQFVALAADDWYQRRRQDEEGKFFLHVSNQGPRKNAGSSTRQGIYIFTASGKLLTFRNHHDPEVMKAELRKGLKAFRALPNSERAPGAVKIADDPQADPAYHRPPPNGGLILNVYTRILDKKEDGDFCHGQCDFTGGDRAAQDHLWLTAAEWRSLVPANPKKGERRPVPERLLYRLARFHLVDNTRGEPPHWSRQEIRSAKLDLVVEETSDSGVTLRLEGAFVLATDADTEKAQRGFDLALHGMLQYDATKKLIDRFDVVAVGDHWGSGTFTRKARPGRAPLGIALELSRGDRPADLVPPQAARSWQAYLQAEK
ncbi:MAG: hypothetical protein L0215_25610 [Gemmataceae bacterium]|nr:hypothetical protein [Gemmataceae bacterium]